MQHEIYLKYRSDTIDTNENSKDMEEGENTDKNEGMNKKKHIGWMWAKS